MITPQQVIDEARTYIGVPFHHQGRCRAGVDCVGLLVVVRRALALPVEDRSGYDRQPHAGALAEELSRQLIKLPLRRPLVYEPADVVELAIKGEPHHVGLLTERGTIIHATSGRRGSPNKVVEHRFIYPWTDRVRAHYRMPEFSA